MNKFMIAFAVALATMVSSAASEPAPTRWFNGGIADGFPKANSLKACTWHWDEEESDAAFANGYVEIDADTSNSVDCVANYQADLDRGKVVYHATMIPTVETSKLQDVYGDVKTAFAILLTSNEVSGVVSSNYYCYAKVDTTNGWVKLSGADYAGGEIAVDISVRNEKSTGLSYANFTVTPVGGTAADLTYLGSKDVEITIDDIKCYGLSLAGSGLISSVSATKYVKGSPIIPGLLFNK